MWLGVSIVLAGTTVAFALALLWQRRPAADDQEASPSRDSEATTLDRSRLLAAALDGLEKPVVLVDARGEVVVRNRAAEPYRQARHGGALIEASIQARLEDGLNGEPTTDTVRLYGPPERVMQVSGVPIEIDGVVRGALAVVDDASEPRRIDAMRRDFVANVSHELRTPVGAASLLAETLEDESDPAVIKRFSARIRHEMERLSQLIDDLLDLSRIDVAEPRRESVEISTIVREAAAIVAPIAAGREVVLTVDAAAEGVPMEGDRALLLSAVTNLLENAVKFTGPGGHVAARITPAEDEVTIEITDTGSGIPARDLHRVFERFYRADRGRSSESGGTGLGLSIVRSVALSHGGRVEVESQEGVGSTFRLHLPTVGSAADSRVA